MVKMINDKKLGNIDDLNKSDELFLILLGIMEKLRSPGGCMWDREQNHVSLKKNLIEEAYETVEAIELQDMEELREELGDLFLQIVFHSQIARENGKFDIADVLKGIIKKLLRRHPHVFGQVSVTNSKEILENWEDIKKKERENKPKSMDSIFSGIPKSLPSLHYAYEIQNRASRLGFDWENKEEVFAKIKEELTEFRKEIENANDDLAADELGDLLFSIVNYSRHLGFDCEQSLKDTSKKFIKRFKMMEKYAETDNIDFKNLSLREKDLLWEKAKKEIG